MHARTKDMILAPEMIEEVRRELDAVTDAGWREIALDGARRCRGMARSARRHRSGKYNGVTADIWEEHARAQEDVCHRADYDMVWLGWIAYLKERTSTGARKSKARRAA